ncbi:hypothetical protein E2C01_045052 [Portunus trituberculatus]|uniref:Uncharacterized protein n=1 Tax=Portunus trituberculatus TaxID=210409 RepID=A0A5B7FTQ4_PORTR|nr:hypothetical protein [Portunus trituberculatus]
MNGPQALFSSFSQDILFSVPEIEEALSTSEDCSERYSRNVQQTLPQSRVTEYEYGKVGHDMPFKGVGPLALSVLKGMCNTRYLVFQEMVNNIDSIEI